MSSPAHLPPGPPGDDPSRADVGLVCALPLESGAFLKKCDHVRKYSGGRFTFRGGRIGGLRIAIVETGGGPRLADRGTRALIDAHHPSWVISAGFSGALQPDLQRRDLVIGTAVCREDGRELAFDLKYPNDPARRVHSGGLLNTAHIVRTVEDKRRLGEQTGCLAVDLESFSVANVCRELGQRFLAVRVISDDLSADLPPEAVAIFSNTGYRRWGAVASSLWRRPGSASDLWGLREQASEAAESLASFLVQILPALAPAPAEPEDA